MTSAATGKALLRILGFGLCAAAILGNQWILAALFSPDGSLGQRSRLLIWLFQAAALAGGVVLLRASRKVENPMAWIRSGYDFLSMQFFNFFILFLAANIVCAFLGRESAGLPWQTELYREPIDLFHHDREFLRKIYLGYSDDDIWELINPPSSVAHPTIEYMSGPHGSRHYQIGLEGIRYDSRVTEANAADNLDGSTWVFGGSTVFGAGVSSDETIVHFLNELDSGSTYLNFGFPSYHQNLELDKLLLLLHKGYRPKRVIFVDGWNDFYALRGSRFHPAETPAKIQHAYGSVTSMENFLDPPAVITLGQFPLFRFLFSIRDSNRLTGGDPPSGAFDDIYSAEALYHTDPIFHYRQSVVKHRDYAGALNRQDAYQDQVKNYYTMNAGYLQALEKGFGFDAFVFLQPLGSMTDQNPFLRDPDHFRKHPYHQITARMQEGARTLIREGELKDFYDLSEVDRSLGHCYVDAAHYNPELCQEIARSILNILKADSNP